MIVITGGAGFIGSNLIKELNGRGLTKIVVVDDLKDDGKFRNLADCKIADFIDTTRFREMIQTNSMSIRPRIIFHYGTRDAVPSEITGENDLLDTHFTYPKELLNWCKSHQARFIYASSDKVYGNHSDVGEDAGMEAPMKTSAYFQMLFDQYVVHNTEVRSPQIVGLRLFSVYGPNEDYKGDSASVPFQFYQKRKEFKVIKLLGDNDGYKGGQQKRDFVHVEDVARLNCWFLDHPEISGIYNVGTGVATSFHDLATLVARYFGKPEGYIGSEEFPAHLKGRFQNETCANTAKLRRAGSTLRFRTIEEGIREYMEWLDSREVSRNNSPKLRSNPSEK
ncbi:hypothetical protein N7452_010401 [Penicillium brevicompactum]|uniref:NAD-dependent epimerase/dehydratase domain-containing protein n=1 Tax=Penicillium brevicompactum TaxID=5074 RepID=A0A9W9QAA2_PENBR|nr:hypothetical protein N7452_010401 [Penicillium brevicompactum]